MIPSGDADCGRLFLDMVYNFGSERLEAARRAGNWRLVLNTDAFGDAMRWVRSMSLEGCIDHSAPYGVEDWAAAMAAGEIAVAFCRSDSLSTALAAEPGLNGSIAFVPMPAAEGVNSSSVWGGTVFAVSSRADSAQTEGAFLFLQFMGYGPDAGEGTFSVVEHNIRERSRQGVPVFPVLSVWADEAYEAHLRAVYAEFQTWTRRTSGNFTTDSTRASARASRMPREELYTQLDSLFDKMLFDATTSNIVTLIADGEREFTERYLSGIGSA